MRDYFAGDPRTNWDRLSDGDWYISDDSVHAHHRAALKAVGRFNAMYPEDPEAAREILAGLLGALGAGSVVRGPIQLDYGAQLRIGSKVFINWGLSALDVAPITIGDHCQIGPNVQLLTAVHPIHPGPRRDGVEGARPITLGDNVWLGGGVIVLPGVEIGDDAVVGAGAVVSRDIPPGSVAVGNPARVIRQISEAERAQGGLPPPL